MYIKSLNYVLKNIPKYKSVNKIMSNIGGMSLPRLQFDTLEIATKTQIADSTKLGIMSYLKALKYSLHVTPNEAKNIVSKDGADFFNEAWSFILKKLKVSSKIQPGITVVAKESKVPFSYSFINNSVNVPDNILEYPKETILNVMRHEFQHYMQNITIIRSKKGLAMCEEHANSLYKVISDNIKATIKAPNFTEVLKTMKPEEQVTFSKCAECLKNNDEIGFNKILQPLKESYKSYWLSIRENALKEFGALTEKEESKALKYINDVHNLSYYNADGSIDIVKHMTTGIENEANIAGELFKDEVMGNCHLKSLKTSIDYVLNSKDPAMLKFKNDIQKSISSKGIENVII